VDHDQANPPSERIGTLGVIYLQLGRFSGVESLYGWELYDRVLRLTTESLRADLDSSPLKARLLSLQFNGADGFYLLFELPARPNGGKNGTRLEDEARRFRDGTVKRLRQSLGRTAVDLMSVHASCIKVPDDPRVRPSRHILRGLQEAARQVAMRETQQKQELLTEFRELMTGRKLRAVYQPVMDIRKKAVSATRRSSAARWAAIWRRPTCSSPPPGRRGSSWSWRTSAWRGSSPTCPPR
jgi:predicted signal transduction protein with EAL and GGDEF domain